MADSLTCPYCNAQQPTTPGLTLGQKLVCARCGDAFTITHLPENQSAPAITAPSPSPVPSGGTIVRPVRANRLVAGIVLGVMALMAGTGLTYALLTVQTRRDHDRVLPRKPRRPWLSDRTPTEPESVTPAQLVGLGYLPRETGLIVGLHVEDLLGSPAGKDLRNQSVKIGNGEFSLESIREWTGLDSDSIDHAVLGVTVRDGEDTDLTPPTHLVVRTRRPYRPERVRVALEATRSREEPIPGGGKRTLYSARVRKLPVSLWLADDYTLVLGLFSKLEQVPGKPTEGLTHLPPELREVIEKRLASGTPAWVAGHAADWRKTWLPALVGERKDVPLVARLEQVRTFALWLIPTRPAKLGGAFRCIDEVAARTIEKVELAPRQKANAETFKYDRQGMWLDVQVALP